MEWNLEGLAILKEVIQAFDELGIPYAVGGSVASSIQGKPRFTLDADISVEPFPGREAELVSRFGGDYYISLPAVKEAVRDRSSFNIIQTAKAAKVDVFVRKDRPFELSAMHRKRNLVLAEQGLGAIQVLSPEDIILHKLEWYRLGDEVSDRQWSDILGVIQVQGERLDRAYLQKWAEELGVADLLARAFSQA